MFFFVLGCIAALVEGATWPLWALFLSNAIQDAATAAYLTPDKIEETLQPSVLQFLYLGFSSSIAQMIRLSVLRVQGDVSCGCAPALLSSFLRHTSPGSRSCTSSPCSGKKWRGTIYSSQAM